MHITYSERADAGEGKMHIIISRKLFEGSQNYTSFHEAPDQTIRSVWTDSTETDCYRAKWHKERKSPRHHHEVFNLIITEHYSNSSQRHTETWQTAWKRRISAGKWPTRQREKEKEREGITQGWRKTLVAHGNRREKSIWCLWMLVEDAELVPFGRGGKLLVLSAEEALTDFSQL